MTPFDSSEELKDLRKKWQGTVVRCVRNGKLEPVLIKDFMATDHGLIKIQTKTEGTIIIPHSFEEWDVTLPERGWFNTFHGAHFVRRLSHRQWRLGLCADTVAFVRPTYYWRLSVHPATTVVGPSYYNLGHTADAWEGSFVELELAARMLRKGKRAEVAVSRDIALTLSPEKDAENLVVWYDLTPVGQYDDKTNKMIVSNPSFHQEMADYISREELQCDLKSHSY